MQDVKEDGIGVFQVRGAVDADTAISGFIYEVIAVDEREQRWTEERKGVDISAVIEKGDDVQENVSGENREGRHDCGDWIGTGEVGIHLHYSSRLEGSSVAAHSGGPTRTGGGRASEPRWSRPASHHLACSIELI